jgi:hypothetical protein
VARTYLMLAFDANAEQAVAQTLTGEYPDALVDHFHSELNNLRGFLQSIAQQQQQRKGS